MALFEFVELRATGNANARIRLKGENDRLIADQELRNEATRIKDARMARIDPYQRPQYLPAERMAILELKAAGGWSLERTAKTFLVTPATIASWMKRLDEEGPAALVQLPGEPPNKFPQFVRHCVQRLKKLSPSMGKVKCAIVGNNSIAMAFVTGAAGKASSLRATGRWENMARFPSSKDSFSP